MPRIFAFLALILGAAFAVAGLIGALLPGAAAATAGLAGLQILWLIAAAITVRTACTSTRLPIFRTAMTSY